MKNSTVKKALVVLAIILVIASISSLCFASTLDPNQIVARESATSQNIRTISGTVLGILQVIGIAVAVIVLVILAIKYISAAPAQKADIKQSAFAYIIGALLLFGGVAVLNVVQRAAEQVKTDVGAYSYGVVEYK